jgi:hypothetical protein
MIALKVLIPLTTDGHHYTLELQGCSFCGEQRTLFVGALELVNYERAIRFSTQRMSFEN